MNQCSSVQALDSPACSLSLHVDLELGLKLHGTDYKPAVSVGSQMTMRWLTSQTVLVTAHTCRGVPTCWGVHLHFSSFSAASHVMMWGQLLCRQQHMALLRCSPS